MTGNWFGVLIALVGVLGGLVTILRKEREFRNSQRAQEIAFDQKLKVIQIETEAAREKADFQLRLDMQKENANQKARLDQAINDAFLHAEKAAAAETLNDSYRARLEIVEATSAQQQKDREVLIAKQTDLLITIKELEVIKDRIVPSLEGMVLYLQQHNSAISKENDVLRDREQRLLIQVDTLEAATLDMSQQIQVLKEKVRALEAVNDEQSKTTES